MCERNTKKSYCFLAIPGLNGIYFRRYLCLFGKNCKLLDFLACTNVYCGPWTFHHFNVNQKTLENLFEETITPLLKNRCKKQTFKTIMKIIGKYYRLLPFET